jgi:hypothetical protein
MNENVLSKIRGTEKTSTIWSHSYTESQIADTEVESRMLVIRGGEGIGDRDGER